jgi:DNA-binding CsgD family transcriptional regulator
VIVQAGADGQGAAVAHAEWAASVFYNGLGRHEQALAAAVRSSRQPWGVGASSWALPEIVEAAVRTGDLLSAHEALARLADSTQAGDADFGLGVEARCRALLANGPAAEDLYREAVDRLSRTGFPLEVARTQLLHGEWLNQEGCRGQAQVPLRDAFDQFSTLGAEAFADRARRALSVTGERVRRRATKAVGLLTAQESMIARLACEGRTNPEIGARLSLSGRTVEWHLRKIFAKLEIASRRELEPALVRLGCLDPQA